MFVVFASMEIQNVQYNTNTNYTREFPVQSGEASFNTEKSIHNTHMQHNNKKKKKKKTG
jgi:uncharacterized protein YukJ